MLERLLAAVGSHGVDRTVAIASAWASHKDQLPGLAITVMALRDANSADYAHTAHLAGMLHRRVSKRHKVTQEDACQALIWWLDHNCPECNGLGHLTVADTPVLQDAACPTCSGSKIRAHPQTGTGYAQCLILLDSCFDWARVVSSRMQMATEARQTAEVA